MVLSLNSRVRHGVAFVISPSAARLDDLPMQNDMPHIHHVVEKDNVGPPMLRVLNEAFLKIVA